MGYQIIYDAKDKHFIKKPKKARRTGIVICILSVLTLGILRFSGWGDTLWQYMLPGDPAVTTEAFQNLAESLKDGQSLSDAVYVFCDTVIQGAGIE